MDSILREKRYTCLSCFIKCRSQLLFKVVVLKNFGSFTEKHLWNLGNTFFTKHRQWFFLLFVYKCFENHCTKNYIFFFQIFWKDGLRKKLRWNMIFLVLSGKMIFLFPENLILFFRRKIKDDLSQKISMEIWYLLQMFWEDGLSKKIALEYDFPCIIKKDGFLSPKIWSYSLDRK